MIKWIGAVAVTALSASVLVLSGIGAAVASADPRGHRGPDLSDVDLIDVDVRDVLNNNTILNNINILSGNHVEDLDILD